MRDDNRIFTEKLAPGCFHTIQMEKVLENSQTKYQNIKIFDTLSNGRVLVLDDIVQITDRDEYSYSEMLVHVPCFAHGNVEEILVIGGGDGAVCEELFKHDTVKSIDLVEIDPQVIALSKKYFPHVCNDVFSDNRLSVHNEDANEFLKTAAVGKYDLIVCDRPDPVGPARALFQKQFYENLARALKPGGLTVLQSGVPQYQAEELVDDLRNLKQVFVHSGVYLTVVPTYVGGFMALTWGSKDLNLKDVAAKDIDARIKLNNVITNYYSSEIHQASFAIPNFIQKISAQAYF